MTVVRSLVLGTVLIAGSLLALPATAAHAVDCFLGIEIDVVAVGEPVIFDRPPCDVVGNGLYSAYGTPTSLTTPIGVPEEPSLSPDNPTGILEEESGVWRLQPVGARPYRAWSLTLLEPSFAERSQARFGLFYHDSSQRTDDFPGFANSPFFLIANLPDITAAPASLPEARVGEPVPVAPISLVGGQGSTSVTVISGRLPAGVALAGDRLRGIPGEAGTFPLRALVTDAAGFGRLIDYTLLVRPPTLRFDGAALPRSLVDVPALIELPAALGGIGPLTYRLSGGALPGGLELDPAGVISGTPDTAGTFEFEVEVRDSTPGGFGTASATFTARVDLAPAPVLAPLTITISPQRLADVIHVDLTPVSSGRVASYSVAVAPEFGDVSVSGSALEYRPALGRYGDRGIDVIAIAPGGARSSTTIVVRVPEPAVVRVLDPAPYPGGEVSLVGSGWAGGGTVAIGGDAAPEALGSTVAGADGTIRATLLVPASTTPGALRLRLTGVDAAGEPLELWATVVVVPPPPAGGGPTPSPAPADEADVAGPRSSALAATGGNGIDLGLVVAACLLLGGTLLSRAGSRQAPRTRN